MGWWYAYALICLAMSVIILYTFEDRKTNFITDVLLVFAIAITLAVGVPLIPVVAFISNKLNMGVYDE